LSVRGGVAIAVGVAPGAAFATGRGHVQERSPLAIEGVLGLLLVVRMVPLHPSGGHIGAEHSAHKGLASGRRAIVE